MKCCFDTQYLTQSPVKFIALVDTKYIPDYFLPPLLGNHKDISGVCGMRLIIPLILKTSLLLKSSPLVTEVRLGTPPTPIASTWGII